MAILDQQKQIVEFETVTEVLHYNTGNCWKFTFMLLNPLLISLSVLLVVGTEISLVQG